MESQLTKSAAPQSFRNILSILFPRFVEASKEGFSIHSMVRPTDESIADQEKRICSSDYFSIYFRSAVPEDMFSEAELSRTIASLNQASTEIACERIFVAVLDGIPKHHARRTDFLWKLGRSVASRLNDTASERLAYVVASRATDYAYDLVNIGEAARALNVVFESAQRFSSSSRAQEILLGAMKRAADDTFAYRLLEYIENSGRNKILTNFKYVEPENLKVAFMERMRHRYGSDVDAEKVGIAAVDWWAFRRWADNSAGDKGTEQRFWRRYIGTSRKKLAQALNFMYPAGFTWSSDPREAVEALYCAIPRIAWGQVV